MEVVVATWNLQGRSPARAGMQDLLAAFDPDVLLLQEASAEEIDREPMLAAHAHRILRPDAGYRPGMAILSRHRIIATGDLAPSTPREPRARLVWATIQLEGLGPMVAATFHAAAPIGDPRSDHPWARSVHLAAIAAFAATLADAGTPAVIGGDSNTVRYRIARYEDAATNAERTARTWRPIGGMPRMPAVARLDRIFFGPGWEIVSVDTACGLSRSDHCPVIARARLLPSHA